MSVKGVKDARVEYEKNRAWVKYDPGVVTPEKVIETLNKTTDFKAKYLVP
jgi:copper chaperone CopZ